MDDEQIIERWIANSAPWSLAVRSGRIASRVEVTNAAVMDAVLSRSPRNVFDIGCGEGWLARELSGNGIDVLGIDVVPELVAQARSAGGGRFLAMRYEDLAASGMDERFDLCVCNFSLLGEHSTRQVIAAIPAMLNPGGALIVQTLHPWVACGDAPYRDGWRAGSWLGIEGDFSDPAPWYFRTLQGWIQLFASAGLRLESVQEPRAAHTQLPVSLILVGVAER